MKMNVCLCSAAVCACLLEEGCLQAGSVRREETGLAE